jgi:hypothetical protein
MPAKSNASGFGNGLHKSRNHLETEMAKKIKVNIFDDMRKHFVTPQPTSGENR